MHEIAVEIYISEIVKLTDKFDSPSLTLEKAQSLCKNKQKKGFFCYEITPENFNGSYYDILKGLFEFMYEDFSHSKLDAFVQKNSDNEKIVKFMKSFVSHINRKKKLGDMKLIFEQDKQKTNHIYCCIPKSFCIDYVKINK